jgi:transcriptional regulator with XRE-family HTH domain
MNVVKRLRWQSDLTQAELASRSGTSQPTVAAYEAGKKQPNLRTLSGMASGAGFELYVEFVPPLTREDRRSLHLHRRIAQRLMADPEATLQRARANLAKMRAENPGAAPLLDAWACILDWPMHAIVAEMTNPSQWHRDLRQVTPFAGVLSASERASVLSEFRRQEGAAG